MTIRFAPAALAAAVASLLAGAAVEAQPIGTFSWQLQPFCNVVTVNVTQQGGVYTLDGYDNQCGAPQRAPLVGLGAPNPDGTIGFGLHLVTVPGGRGVQIEARITLAAFGGTWSDSAGNSGTFAFNASSGGNPRPAPTVPGSAIAPGSISSLQLAPGVIGAGQINASQVQARVGGTCARGQALRGVRTDGTVVCTDALTNADAPASDVGNFGSVTIGTDGLPVIAHHDATLGAVRVTHCGNAACTNGNVSTTVDDPVNSVGLDTSIAIGVDGLPIVSYRDVNGGTLRVTHCGNAACTAGNISTTVDDPANIVGHYSAIAIGTDGLPVISHQDVSAGTLRVTHCGNVACTAGNVSTTVDDPANLVGAFTAIAIGTDGLPVISHRDATALTLRVTHCGNAACTAGNVSATIDPVYGVGFYTALAIGADGLPIISHQDAAAGALRVTHCGTVGCSAGNISTTVDAPGNQVGRTSAIAVGADGLAIISHQDGTAGALRVTHCGNVACTAGNVSVTVDDPVNTVGLHSAIAIGTDGLPVISHSDQTARALRVAKCGTATCQ